MTSDQKLRLQDIIDVVNTESGARRTYTSDDIKLALEHDPVPWYKKKSFWLAVAGVTKAILEAYNIQIPLETIVEVFKNVP